MSRFTNVYVPSRQFCLLLLAVCVYIACGAIIVEPFLSPSASTVVAGPINRPTTPMLEFRVVAAPSFVPSFRSVARRHPGGLVADVDRPSW